MLNDLGNTVVVLDLDDTIYKERDYRSSGFKFVCNLVRNLYDGDSELSAEKILAESTDDPLAVLCSRAGIPQSTKESLLWAYRLHTPSIKLSDEVATTIRFLEKSALEVVILTDGRSVTQRLKLKALGLTHLKAYISEEYESEKPDNLRFKRIMESYPAKHYAYVGDNPAKDFIAPRALGWMTIGVREGGGNIHSQAITSDRNENYPDFWIDTFDCLAPSATESN